MVHDDGIGIEEHEEGEQRVEVDRTPDRPQPPSRRRCRAPRGLGPGKRKDRQRCDPRDRRGRERFGRRAARLPSCRAERVQAAHAPTAAAAVPAPISSVCACCDRHPRGEYDSGDDAEDDRRMELRETRDHDRPHHDQQREWHESERHRFAGAERRTNQMRADHPMSTSISSATRIAPTARALISFRPKAGSTKPETTAARATPSAAFHHPLR